MSQQTYEATDDDGCSLWAVHWRAVDPESVHPLRTAYDAEQLVWAPDPDEAISIVCETCDDIYPSKSPAWRAEPCDTRTFYAWLSSALGARVIRRDPDDRYEWQFVSDASMKALYDERGRHFQEWLDHPRLPIEVG